MTMSIKTDETVTITEIAQIIVVTSAGLCAVKVNDRNVEAYLIAMIGAAASEFGTLVRLPDTIKQTGSIVMTPAAKG